MKDNRREPALDPVEITLILLILLGGLLILPAAFWHGTTDSGGWRWDVHSTAACGIWWGILLLGAIWGVLAHANSPRVKAIEEHRRRTGLWGTSLGQPDLRILHGKPALEPEEGLHPPF